MAACRNDAVAVPTSTDRPDQFGHSTSPAAAVDWWLHSEGHRKTLLDPIYKETGIGVLRGTASMGLPADAEGAIFIQCFGGCADPELLVPTQLWAWGGNGSGQLGVGSGTSATSAPIHPAEFEGFIEVDCSHHSIGLMHDGTVWTWGPRENKGSTPGGSPVPVKVNGIDQVMAVSAGYDHNLAVKTDGSVWAWGDNRYGELGDGSGADQESPVKVRGLTGIKAISAGGGFSLALDAYGSVWGWGSNGNAQLGRDPGSPNDQFDFPTRISSLPGRIEAIAAGSNHTVALEGKPGQMWVFGLNIAGCLGTGDPDKLFYQDPTKPAPTTNFTGQNIIAIAADFYNSYAVDNSGKVWAMGNNAFHQLGPNVDVLSRDALAHLIPRVSKVVEVSAGQGHALALTSDEDLWSWGSNSAGQLGQGVVIGPDHAPDKIAMDHVTSFSAGYVHSLAIGHRDE